MDPEKKRHLFKKFSLDDIFIGLTILLGVILITNIFLAYGVNKELKKSTDLIEEKLKPAKIELVLVKNSKCADCFDISTIVSHVKNANLNITKETMHEFDSKEGKELISRYKIEKIPTIILTGEIEKVSIQGLEKRENALLLTQLEPPYTNALTGKIEGKVSLYILKDTACEKCNDLSLLINQIKAAGIKIAEEKTMSTSSDDGKELATKYNIDFVPTIILSKDASAYAIMQQAWPQIGSRETDGSYVLRVVSPPFINLTTAKLRGLIDITYLIDKTCTECYNVSQHRLILANPQGFAMKLDEEETYDIADAKGKELIAKYSITQVPTIILSNEVSVYPSSLALKEFFSVENDGSYIFRQINVVGTYKDLAANQVVVPQQNEQ